jgi:hypothetical protein
MTGFGRSATELFLQTRHSARRSRDRRHPANHDPKLTLIDARLLEVRITLSSAFRMIARRRSHVT